MSESARTNRITILQDANPRIADISDCITCGRGLLADTPAAFTITQPDGQIRFRLCEPCIKRYGRRWQSRAMQAAIYRRLELITAQESARETP